MNKKTNLPQTKRIVSKNDCLCIATEVMNYFWYEFLRIGEIVDDGEEYNYNLENSIESIIKEFFELENGKESVSFSIDNDNTRDIAIKIMDLLWYDYLGMGTPQEIEPYNWDLQDTIHNILNEYLDVKEEI